MMRFSTVLLFAAISGAVIGCTTDLPAATQCRDIPANGCLLLGDDSECTDPTCAAAYTCTNDASWSLAHTCPGFDGGHGFDASTSNLAEAGELRDVSGIDVPPGAAGGPGCGDLQNPDCPLSEALLCNPASMDPCCGCESLFVCHAGNWTPWGSCTDEGGVTLNPSSYGDH